MIGRFKKFKNSSLICLSAFMFHIALYYPVCFFWLSFLYLIPIFYGAIANPKSFSFKMGFLWGIIFFSFHLYSFFMLIINECNGRFRFLFPIILLFYVSFHIAIYFWLANKTIFLFRKKKNYFFLKFILVISWIIWTWFFLLWIPIGLLWFSGSSIGYPLMFPLLPLAEYPIFLTALRFFSLEFLLLFLILFSMMSALFLNNFTKKYLFMATFFLSPFLIGFVFPTQSEKTPDFFKTFGYIPPPNFPEKTPALDVAQEIYYRIIQLIKKYPQIQYIVMPELCCRFSLNKRQDIIDLWTTNALKNKISLLLGACRSEKGESYNSFYFIKNGKVQQISDKMLLMPFAEYIPSFFKKFQCCQKLFLSNNCGFKAGTKKIDFHFQNGFNSKNDICAEAIFKKTFFCSGASDNDFVLSTFNDSLSSFSFHHLFLLWVKLQGLKQKKVQLFIGYSFACLISPEGNIFKIRSY